MTEPAAPRAPAAPQPSRGYHVGTEGIQELAEIVAVAAADLVIRINGHAVPEPPDAHHLDEIVYDEDAESPSLEEVVAQHGEINRQLGMAIAEEIGRPGEVFIFGESELLYTQPAEERTTVVRWERGETEPQYSTLDEDEDDDEFGALTGRPRSGSPGRARRATLP